MLTFLPEICANISQLEFEIQNVKMSGFYNSHIVNLQVCVLGLKTINFDFGLRTLRL